MATDVAIRLGVDGEREFKKALSGVDAQIKNLNSELRVVVSSLTGMDDAEGATTQKTNILGRSIDATKKKISILSSEYDQQKKKLDELGKALDDAQNAQEKDEKAITRAANAYNEQAAKVNKLGTQLNNATADLNRFEQEMRDIRSATDKAADSMGDMADEAEKTDNSLKDAFTGGAIAGGIQSLVSGMMSLVDETQEYRRIMASLEVSSQNAGYTAEQTAESYRTLFGVLADEQTAATTTANLQALGLAQEDLQSIIDSTIGAWATYGDSIPIDGLAESINETIRAGQVTGTFADVLNWGSKEGENFGVALKENVEANEEWNNAVEDAASAEDYFNLALQDAETQTERVNLVMQAMSKQGLAKVGKAWRDNNKDLIEANEATADMNESLADMSERLTPIANTLKKAMAQGVGALVDGFDFAAEHGKEFVSVLAGVGTAVGGMKVATIAKDLAGVASAAKAGTAALAAYETATGAAAVTQGALSTAMALTPTGALAIGLTALVGGLAVYANQAELGKTRTDELRERAEELNAVYEEQQTELEEIAARRDEQLSSSMAEINHTQSMIEELNSLKDANGRVRDGEELRAQTLANLINEVMPGAVEWTQKQSGAYIETAEALDLLIQKEQLKAWLDANQEGYQTAIQNQQEYIQNITNERAELATLNTTLQDYKTQLEKARNEADMVEFDKLKMEISNTNDLISDAKTRLADYEQDYVNSVNTIAQYESIKAASLSNDEAKIRSALDQTKLNLKQYTGDNLLELAQQAADAQANYQTMVEMSKKYPKIISENQLNEAKNRADQAKIIAEQAGKEEAAAQASGIKSKEGEVNKAGEDIADEGVKGAASKNDDMAREGDNFGQGYVDSIRAKIPAARKAGADLSGAALESAREEQDSHSPSREMMKVGGWFTQGYTIGILSQVPALVSGVRGMVKDLIGVTTDTAETYVKRSSKTITNAVEKELNRLNTRIAEIEAEAAEKQAEKELATYKENLKKKNEELAKAETKERQKILDEIAKLESDWNEKQLKAQQDAEKKKLQEQVKTLEQFQKEYESALQEIEKSQDTMANKLADYGELFTTVKKETGSFLELGDLQEDIDAINRYGDALEQLKARGVSDSLMNEIVGMNIDDATAYTEQLLSKTDDEYAEYMALWEQKQKDAQEIARKFYSDEMDALQDEFVDKIPVELGGVKDEMRTIGVNGIQGMIDGMYSKSGALYSAAASIVSQAIAAMRAAASIHSPSRKTAQLVGMPMAQGVEQGFLDKMEESRRNIAAAVMSPIERIRRDDMYNAAAATVNGMASVPAMAPQTIVIPVNLNGKQIAEVVYDPLKQVGKQRGY